MQKKARKMQKIKLLLPFLLFFGLVVFFWKGLSVHSQAVRSPLIGKPVPDFHAENLFHSKQMLNKKIFLHHVSVLNIFATWCYSCRAEQNVLLTLHQQAPTVQL